MKLFLYGVLELIKNQKSESCGIIEEQMRIGVASVLYSKYSKLFNGLGFHSDKCQEIDEYYKRYVGVVDGKENKYACESNDGLYLIIKLALEEMY